MLIISSCFVGLLTGFIASNIDFRNRGGVVIDAILGISGAWAGEFLRSLFGASPVAGLNAYGMLASSFGAMAVLVLYHAVTSYRSNLG